MVSILSMNCVVSGELEWYCLACRALLQTEQLALDHVRESNHARNVSASAYLPELEHHFVRKVAGVYFCEACGVALATVARARLHVALASHAARRSARMLRRAGDDALLFRDHVEIAARAWHGLVGDDCLLCDTELQPDATHTAEQKHILNLITCKVTVTDDGDIYRQVGEHYHCLSCNKLLTAEGLKEHLKSAQHRSSLTKRDTYQQHDTPAFDRDERSGDQSHKTAEETQNVADKASHDEQSTTSVKDAESKPTNPVLSNKKQESPRLASTSQSEKNLRVQNGQSAESGATCSTGEPAKTKESSQRSNLNKQGSHKLSKVHIMEYVTEMSLVVIRHYTGNVEDEYPCLVINNTFIINLHHFAGFELVHNKFICKICPIDLAQHEVDKRLEQHADAIDNSYVITSLKNDFVRQLKTDLFDCTYCGHFVHAWDDMLQHLQTEEHKKCRTAHQKLLLKFKMSKFERQDVVDFMPINIATMFQRMHMF